MDAIMPKQPFLLFATKHFTKLEVMQYGISHFFTFCADADTYDMAEVVPDGCVDIMFLCHQDVPRANYIGTPLHADSLQNQKFFHKNDVIFGVRLLQGNMAWMRNCSAKEILDTSLDFAAVSGQTELMERVCSSNSFEEQIQIFMQYYMPEYRRGNAKDTSEKQIPFYMMHRILESNGLVKIQELSEESAFSVRHLNELFRTAYGVSPKEYEKLVRFQNILKQLECAPHIIDAAVEAGYYDQSHMLKEFRGLLGVSPKVYLKKRQMLAKKDLMLRRSLPEFSRMCI